MESTLLVALFFSIPTTKSELALAVFLTSLCFCWYPIVLFIALLAASAGTIYITSPWSWASGGSSRCRSVIWSEEEFWCRIYWWWPSRWSSFMIALLASFFPRFFLARELFVSMAASSLSTNLFCILKRSSCSCDEPISEASRDCTRVGLQPVVLAPWSSSL